MEQVWRFLTLEILLPAGTIVPAGWSFFGPAAPAPADDLFHINFLGRWSYALALAPYYVLLICLLWRYRVILQFARWRFFFNVTVMFLLLLGVTFEWIADVLYVWTFPAGRDLFMIQVPIFGWLTGHRIPICEFLWIVGVVPLFYYLYLWATLVFNDIVYVVDENGQTYKVEQRWAGFHETTRILVRAKGMKGREHERALLERPPGFVARTSKKLLSSRNA